MELVLGMLLVSSLCLLFLMRLWWILPGFSSGEPPKPRGLKRLKTVIVLGSGGHTAEMFRLLRGFSSSVYSPRTYVVADTDNHSAAKAQAFESSLESSHFEIKVIPRSREVGQSYFTSLFSTLRSLLASVVIVFKSRPDVVIVNGPGTCVPISLLAFLFRALLLNSAQIIYVESICRVDDLSLSARILYPFISVLFVQWPELCKHRKAVYKGLLSH